jgi:hypothetical protein
MEKHTAILEESVIDTGKLIGRVETWRDSTATKSDMAILKFELVAELRKGFTDMIKWIVGTGVMLGTTGFTVMFLVLNYGMPGLPAYPVSPPAPAVQVIIIQLPTQATPVLPPAR